MGTPCSLWLSALQAQTQMAAAAIVADVMRLEQRYSRYRQDSLLSAINRVAAQGGSVTVDAETSALLDYAQACYQQSAGLFDVTAGRLRQLWRFGSHDATRTVPTPEQLAALQAQIGWDKLRWLPPVLSFPWPGLELDLGGIVKEYAVDRAVQLACAHGVTGGVINLGGDIRVLGPRPDGSPWRISIQHPRQPGELHALHLEHGAVASSGDYARSILLNGVRYGHILNPRTGWPTRYLVAVTVLAELCVVAGSAATIAMLKEQDGPAWLAELGLPHLWMDIAGRVGGSRC